MVCSSWRAEFQSQEVPGRKESCFTSAQSVVRCLRVSACPFLQELRPMLAVPPWVSSPHRCASQLRPTQVCPCAVRMMEVGPRQVLWEDHGSCCCCYNPVNCSAHCHQGVHPLEIQLFQDAFATLATGHDRLRADLDARVCQTCFLGRMFHNRQRECQRLQFQWLPWLVGLRWM